MAREVANVTRGVDDVAFDVADVAFEVGDVAREVADVAFEVVHPMLDVADVARGERAPARGGGSANEKGRPKAARVSDRAAQAGSATLREARLKRPPISRRSSSRPCAPPESLICE